MANGFICCVMAKALVPWLTRPNQALVPDMSVGVGKSLMASTNVVLGRTFVGVLESSAKSTVSWVN